MITYLIISGIAMNALLGGMLALCLWLWFIFPCLEAISMVRWSRAMHAQWPSLVSKPPFWKLFYHHYEAFGRNWTNIRCRAGEWHGIGNWTVYSTEED